MFKQLHKMHNQYTIHNTRFPRCFSLFLKYCNEDKKTKYYKNTLNHPNKSYPGINLGTLSSFVCVYMCVARRIFISRRKHAGVCFRETYATGIRADRSLPVNR